MKKMYVFGIIGIAVLSLMLGVCILLNNKEEPIVQEKNVINIGHYKESIIEEENYVFTNYNDYKMKFNGDKLKESDFEKSNYALITIEYNSCADSDINIANYSIDGNKIDVLVEYYASCGVCAPEYLYYVLPVDKKITKVDVDIDFKSLNVLDCDPNIAYKPMIYLYPTSQIDVSIKLVKESYLTTTYPKYDESWEVTAASDGTLIDRKTGRSFYGLYWEANNHQATIQNEGFIVSGEDTISFLEEKLRILGLTEHESNEFIIYWLPKLENNKYNYIRFETIDEINNYMPLDINPKPDTVIRILMDYKPLDKPIAVDEQKLVTPKREGFTLVEWGGSLIK